MRRNATVQVLRLGSAVSNLVETVTGYAQVYAAVPCLVEPLRSWSKANLLGQVGGRVFRMSWDGGETIQDGDRVVWSGSNFKVNYDSDDRYRGSSGVGAYQTATLIEEGA